MSNKKQSIFKSAILVTAMMLGFKVLGFVKQAVVAYYFGATAETDIYFIAWGFVTGLSDSMVKAMTASAVAIYTRVRIRDGEEEATRLINSLIETVAPFALLLMGVLFLGAPFLSRILAPGYQGETTTILTGYIRLLLPVLVLAVIPMSLSAVLDSNKSFFAPRMESFVYSMCTIFGCIFLSGILGVSALLVSYYASFVLFCLIVLITVHKYHTIRPTNPLKSPMLKKVLLTALPLFVGNSVLQINEMVDKAITSGLQEGATSALYYCQTLDQFVTSVMIVNIGNVMLANFAESVAKRDEETVTKQLSKVINLLIVLLIGVSVITMTCAKEIVSFVFFRGSFTEEAVAMSSLALTGYAIAFAAVAVREMTARGLYAYQDTKKAMITSLTTIAINIVLSILLSKVLGIFGIALATSVSGFIGMIMNGVFLKQYIRGYRYGYHLLSVLKCIPAALVLGAFCLVIVRFVPVPNLVKLLIVGIIGLAVYFGILYAFRVTEIRELTGKAYKKARSKISKQNGR